jgi:signal transduction histidine kinase/DNA-binding response OmpR family regulator
VNLPILSIRIQYEHDVVSVRQRCRQVAEALGFETQQQTRLATAVSEIARNAFSYARGGKVEFFLEGSTPPQLFSIRVTDSGRGIPNLEEVLEGRYRSETGMGLGIIGARRLMDRFRIDTAPETGTTVYLAKLLPRHAPFVTPQLLSRILAGIDVRKPRELLDEFREQNQELLRTLDELRRRQEELISLNRELEDTNRGVVALYAELDEKADHLRRADEVKSRFLSNMSHEFRTPLNSILALSRLLLERADGPLTTEQEIQVTYIRKSADSLFELVNDLLDLAKVEAGKTEIRSTEFEVSALFGALRGMLRPLLVSSTLNLVFDEPAGIPPLFSDEGKISQILRNFISNALKFTEAGEVRVSAEYAESDGFVTFRVRDTGIGIAPADQETIFKEFAQLDSHLQRRVKGTGLGLPLSRRLAELLGGSVSVESELGAGSVFSLALPAKFHEGEPPREPEQQTQVAENQETILLVEDHFETRLAYERYLRATRWHVVAARSVREAENILGNVIPVAIVLDIALRGEDSWSFLAQLKSDPRTSAIPVIIATSVDDRAKAMALGADAYLEKPASSRDLRRLLRQFTGRGPCKVLLVDDEPVSRYLLKQLFSGSEIQFLEAANGDEALERLRTEKPDLVMMDLMMPGRNGFEVLAEMQADFDLKEIPVIVSSSKVLSSQEEHRIAGLAAAVLPKARLAQKDAVSELTKALAAAGLPGLIPERLIPERKAAQL